MRNKRKIIDTIVKNISNDLEGMKIENKSDCGNYSIENSIAHILFNEKCGMSSIIIKDPVALEIDYEDIFEEYTEEVITRKWWMIKPKTINKKFERSILNKEDMEEILLRLTKVYDEYEELKNEN